MTGRRLASLVAPILILFAGVYSAVGQAAAGQTAKTGKLRIVFMPGRTGSEGRP